MKSTNTLKPGQPRLKQMVLQRAADLREAHRVIDMINAVGTEQELHQAASEAGKLDVAPHLLAQVNAELEWATGRFYGNRRRAA